MAQQESKIFRTHFGETTFRGKYAQGVSDSWPLLAKRLVDDVCGTRGGTLPPLMSKDERDELTQFIIAMKFIPGGRYLYYAGRPVHFYNNCFAFKSQEDSREAWAKLVHDAMSALMSGGGIGNDYSVFRPEGSIIGRTGGLASGPIPLMKAVNELGRNVMQGGSRRSAIYGSLNWQHADAPKLLYVKDYPDWMKKKKEEDFNFPCPLDMTNISINFDTEFLHKHLGEGKELPQFWYDSVRQMCSTAEPGHSYNFLQHEGETGRNACAEFTTSDDGDICNLGSINLGRIQSLPDLCDVVRLAAKFLVCGSIRGDVPLESIRLIREKNRKIGLGLMGVHEWLMQRGYKYEVCSELHKWLHMYANLSEEAANEHCDRFYINRPLRYRAIAPAGTIGILAGTTTGIEPIFAPAYKRRFLVGGDTWKYEYVIDGTAKHLTEYYGVDPDSIDNAYSLAEDPEKRIRFQADIQAYVDMAISSTINLPSWGSVNNNEDTCKKFAETLARYAPRLRGFTAYPDGCRGGQPLTIVPYKEALQHEGVIFDESEAQCKGGVCGI